MLSVTQLDFANYWRSFKGNYSKGIHNLANILQTPQQATDLVKNLGGVSVLLGTPAGEEDVNSEVLRNMLLNSPYVDTAINTWLSGFYTFSDLGSLFTDGAVRADIFNSELLWRAISMSGYAMTKYIACCAGLDPSTYLDLEALFTSIEAAEAIGKSAEAVKAVLTSSIAFVVALQYPIFIEAIIDSEEALNAIAISEKAMQAIASNYDTRLAVIKNQHALSVLSTSAYFGAMLDKHTPKMTSNTAPSGVAAGYKLNSNGGDPYLWFDKNLSTRVDPAYGSSGSLTACYVQYMFPEPVIVFAFGLCGGIQNNGVGAVTAVKVQCSNDGSTWTTLESRLDVPGLPSSDLKKYCINNTQAVAAKYWRVHAVAGVNATCVFFNEVDFYYV